MELTIECQPREANTKPNALRRDGKIPAVLYGHKGNESVQLTVAAPFKSLSLRCLGKALPCSRKCKPIPGNRRAFTTSAFLRAKASYG
jgi:hypothetical protein